jgi:hypothetical protein
VWGIRDSGTERQPHSTRVAAALGGNASPSRRVRPRRPASG